MYHKYLDKLNYEIDNLIEEEVMRESDVNDGDIQNDLHILFENRKHLLEYAGITDHTEYTQYSDGKQHSRKRHLRSHETKDADEEDDGDESDEQPVRSVRDRSIFRGGN